MQYGFVVVPISSRRRIHTQSLSQPEQDCVLRIVYYASDSMVCVHCFVLDVGAFNEFNQ